MSKYNLKELRRMKNETQKQTAQSLGINRAIYSHYENGIRTPKVDIATKMATYFNVKLEDIIFLYKNDTISNKSQSA